MASTVAGDAVTQTYRINTIRFQQYALKGLQAITAGYLLQSVEQENSSILLAPLLAFENRASNLYTDYTKTYLKTFRTAEGISGTAPRLPQWTFNTNRAAGSAVAVGINGLKQAMEDFEVTSVYELPTKIQRQKMSNTENWAVREVFRNARNTVVSYTRSDSRAVGYARVTDGDPCRFCAMLATRGPIYSQNSVDFPSHSKCGCSGEPVYNNWSYTPQTEKLAQDWIDKYRIEQNDKMIEKLRRSAPNSDDMKRNKDYIDFLKKNSQEIREGKKGGYLYDDGIGSDIARKASKEDKSVFKQRTGQIYEDYIEERRKEWEKVTDLPFPEPDPQEKKLFNEFWRFKRDGDKPEGRFLELDTLNFR